VAPGLDSAANTFGVILGAVGSQETSMSTGIDVGATDRETAAPAEAPRETIDVRNLGPPTPLAETLERLPELDPGTVLVQYNDRAPQHLYPKLDDRGYEYGTVETDDGTVVTAIWRA
jgi:uncharacterized protein (DUF2249 family)